MPLFERFMRETTPHPQVKLASKRFLAGSLGLAAGVMLYVSLVEIFVKSVDSFSNHGFEEVICVKFLLSLSLLFWWCIMELKYSVER